MMHTSVIHIFQEDKKTFQCKGYGNCRMVFTRSEHLARHQRKHTGEKPFDCIVPGCSRKFSRFDNMMQHTQTHHTTNDKQVPKLIQSKRKRTNSINKSNNNNNNNNNLTKKKKLDLLLDELFSLSDSSQLSSDEEDEAEEEEVVVIEKVQMKEQEQDAIIRHMMTLPHLANYLLDHPDEPPENYFFKYYYRLSKQDLLYPIDYFLSNHHQEQQSTMDDIYITLDEFEALQGLNRFYTCQK